MGPRRSLRSVAIFNEQLGAVAPQHGAHKDWRWQMNFARVDLSIGTWADWRAERGRYASDRNNKAKRPAPTTMKYRRIGIVLAPDA